MFNFDSSGGSSFSPGWSDSFSYNPSSSISNQSGGSGMWPLALAGLGSSLVSGIFGGMASNRQSDAMLQAAGMQAQATRDASFHNLLGGQYALTGAKEFDRFQQQKAADYQQTFLDPRASVLASEDRQRGIADMLSPGAQKLRRQQNTDQLNRTLAEKRAVTDAMFGPVAERPFGYGNAPGYTVG